MRWFWIIGVGLIDVCTCDEVVARVGEEFVHVEVSLIGVTHQVTALVVSGFARLIRGCHGGDADGHLAPVEVTGVGEVAVLRDGHHVALAGDKRCLVFVVS